MDIRFILFVLLGYLSGSVLYARVFCRLFGKEDAIEKSRDQNPGTANAFMYGGFLCGMLTLTFDLLKGFLPVFLYTRLNGAAEAPALCTALVVAAPVIGHAFPAFHHFRGGKGIAVTFGCQIGLLPHALPLLILAAAFIFFSVVLRVSPHSARTAVTYVCTLIGLLLFEKRRSLCLGFSIISATVLYRLFASPEVREPVQVKLL